MKNTKILFVISLFVILMTVFGNVCAQDTSLPAFKVSQVVTDEKVILTTKNFPAEMSYTVSMASQDAPETFTAVAKFNSKNGGSLNVTVKIPEKFQGLGTIILRVQDANGSKMVGSFVNVPEEEPAVEEQPAEQPAEEETITLQNQEPAEEPQAEEQPAEEPAEEETITLQNQEPAEEPKAEEQPAEQPAEEETITLQNQEPAEEPKAEEPAAEEPVIQNEEPAAETKAEEQPAQETVETVQAVENTPAVEEMVCDYSIIPTVHIDAVTRNETVTFTTKDFPADKTFSVSMGVYVESWRPAPIPCCQPVVVRPFKPQTPKDFPNIDAPEKAPVVPGPKYEKVVSFNGTEVGTFNSENGEPQTLTFSIPANLKGVGIIALWVRDLGPCGFYSYNWFYNNTTNW